MVPTKIAIIARKLAKPRILLALVALSFTLLALASALTRAPWCDEAYFAEPAYSLLHTGRMAAITLGPSPIDDPKTFGIDRYMFYTMPLNLIMQAAWYAIAGFGLTQMRLLTIFWGVLGIGAWWTILKELGAEARLRVIAIALIALDYTYIRAGSDGRMDMMSASLGMLGLALFLKVQKRSYTRAVVIACSCCAASAFTHPIGGIVATAEVGVAMLWYSSGRFRWWHVALAALPYAVCAAGWGIYIAQAPEVFRRQFLDMSGPRLTAWKQPFHAMGQEFTSRWMEPFGLTSLTAAKKVKSLTLFLYVLFLCWSLVRFKVILRIGLGILVIVCLLNLALLCFADSTKSAAYLIHVVPWLAALSAIWIDRYWGTAGVALLSCLLIISLGGVFYGISRLQYQREYLPTIAFLRARGGQVTGVADLGFGLGFQRNLKDDPRLGYYTGLRPSLFVLDVNYEDFYRIYRTVHPEIYEYLTAKRSRSHPVFRNSLYSIYEDNQVLR